MTAASVIDIAIIGAGIAGLSAARRALASGYRVNVLEAKDRVGGRAQTVNLGGYPVDLGATWLHSASLNPLVQMAERLGFEAVDGFGRARMFVAKDGDRRWGTDAELGEAIGFRTRTDSEVVTVGDAGRDEPIGTILDSGSRWAPLYEWWIGAYTSADPEEASSLDYARYRETHENLSVPRGLGVLVSTVGAGLPVELSNAVRRVRWSGPGVVLETDSGTLRARAVIVTASTSVLSRGAICFDPELPDWKRDAIEATPLGSANKIVVAFDRNVFGEEGAVTVRIDEGRRETVGLQVRALGRNLASGFVGGDHSKALEADGSEAMIEFMLDRLRWMFGSDITKHVTAVRASSWTSDPWIGGAYSAARPGLAHLRPDLARPLGDRVFFGGEATSDGFYTTVHGGYLSGIRAAEEAIAMLERRRLTR